MKIAKLENGNILIKNNNDEIEHIIATDVFLQLNRYDKTGIMISKTPSNQDIKESILVFSEEVTLVNEESFTGNRNDLLLLLSELFNIGGADSKGGASYSPSVIINTFLPAIVKTNKTTEIIVKGSFLDFINGANVSAINQTGISVSIVSKSFSELVLELTTNTDLQAYTIDLKNPNGQTYTVNLEAKNISIYTPKPSGTAPSLWVKSGSNNSTVVTTGGYEAENSGGNGWNEHAYFGSFTSSSRLEFSFKVDRLQGASNAYCFIRTDNQNNASTGGNPRVYISNGTTFNVYAPNGSSIGNTQIAVDDVIDVVLEVNKYEVFKNGVSIGIYNGAVNLTNIFMTFTGYRVAKLSNINAKVY
ncbi:hypothetical protein PL373_19135 [Tenacibaculum maritimum]|nr:hypothetical protein [Tenacibaculum maritimum]MDB0603204.1 hypothetical protein [Tenacibaculum maritimum]MDB0610466.1 hypothetical protein [Tenacibaculum maritimum]